MADKVLQQDPLSDDLTKLKAQCEEYLAGWKRAQADYSNAVKERERDRAEYVKYANTSLLQSLLPAIEHFSTALRFIPDTASLPEEEKKKWDSWLVGLKAVQSLWEQAAQGAGLERIAVQGPFDPTLHEAVGHEASSEVPAEHILRVMQEGWKLSGRVLRPAQVIVAREADATESNA
jgi:molecular chaperone GrpE